jgi:hypothetical protein
VARLLLVYHLAELDSLLDFLVVALAGAKGLLDRDESSLRERAVALAHHVDGLQLLDALGMAATAQSLEDFLTLFIAIAASAATNEVKIRLVEAKDLRNLRVVDSLNPRKAISGFLTELAKLPQLLFGKMRVELEAGLIELGDRDGALLEDIALHELSVDVLPLVAELLGQLLMLLVGPFLDRVKSPEGAHG